jgi:hypothetical protein
MKHAKANSYHRQRQHERKRAQRQAKQRPAPQRGRGQELVYQIYQTIQHFFPDLFEQMRELEDCRKKADYSLAEILTAGVAMFVLKTGSRNAFNNKREEARFEKNYRRLFKLRLPHLDTVHQVMARLQEDQLEQLKQAMLQALLNKKTLHRFRLLGRYFIIAVDASGVMSFSKSHCEQCLHQTSKKGKTTYFHNVLEAKLIAPNGLALSLATEWIENPEGEYEKQDCEMKAFVRLGEKLKALFPRLPICITADGLYPNQTFFDACQRYDWRFIVTFKDGNLPTVWQEVNALSPRCTEQHHHERLIQGQQRIERRYHWLTDIDYHGHRLHWIECQETIDKEASKRFVHLTDLRPTRANVATLSASGRLRWKIENEGFNCQKNHGYALQHQYARHSYRAAQNYYQCLQIAHLINQLVILSQHFQQRLTGKLTIKHLWEKLCGFLYFARVCVRTLRELDQQRIQIRLV